MRRRFSQLCVISTLIFLIGAHWAILQSVAWVGMAVNYSENGSWSEALQKTFSGQFPCQLCKMVEEGKQSEKKQEAHKLVTQLDFIWNAKLIRLFPPVLCWSVPAVDGSSYLRPETPPGPPPRYV